MTTVSTPRPPAQSPAAPPQARIFRQPARPASETPALIRRETWDDVGFITIGPTKSYGYRCYPGSGNCRRIVRLFCGNGFEEAAYDVCFFHNRPATCDCADAVYRRKDETGRSCKHIRAIAALGLDQTDAEFEAAELDKAAVVEGRDVTAGRVGTADLTEF